MTPERHQRLNLLFDEALERSPEERDAYLCEACGDDAGLRAEIVKLLARDQRASREGFLAPPSVSFNGLGQTPLQATLPARTGEQPVLRGYEIQGELGRGGMGIVYKARQTSLNRIVAVKIILTGDEADGERRIHFRTEAEAIARLQHPNIVQIHEVGEHDGRSFVVLEYVEGGSLAEQLNGMPQPVDASARFVETVARAIHYAHERGIIHRDLKPANVLLQIADRRSQIDNPADNVRQSAICNLQSAIPKITDFGLAKLLRENGESLGDKTPTGMILGTPQYMAPEQARGPREVVGRAADVYALGAIMYELLTGRPVFQGETPLETVEQARLQEPVAPSRLRPKLPRDLEIICLKCLRKEPAQRFTTAEDLAEDLRRFLAGEPIRARPLAAWRRGLKWARRRPATAASLLVASVAIVSILAGGMWYNARLQAALVRAEHEYERAEAKSQEAVEAAERAEDVLKYFVATFRRVDPSKDGAKVTVAEVMKRSAAELPTKADLDGATRAALLNAIGQTLFGLGLPHEAADVLEQAWALRRDELGPEHADTLTSMNNVGMAYQSAGRLSDALPLLEETLKLQKAHLGAEHPNTLNSMNNLALA
jgi:serine/threonine protein kinase